MFYLEQALGGEWDLLSSSVIDSQAEKQTNKQTIDIYNLGTECPCCKLELDLISLDITFRHIEESVSRIYEFVIVSLAHMSCCMCSTHSIVPNFHRLQQKQQKHVISVYKYILADFNWMHDR